MSTPPDSLPDETHTDEPPQEAEQEHPEEQHAAETQKEEEAVSQENTLPPEAQGETNGGPLGCCLGTVAGIFLTATLTTGIPLLLFHYALPGGFAFPLALAGAILCGFFGWKIGKRIYKEYELSPRQKQKLEAWEQRKMQQQQRKRRG